MRCGLVRFGHLDGWRDGFQVLMYRDVDILTQPGRSRTAVGVPLRHKAEEALHECW